MCCEPLLHRGGRRLANVLSTRLPGDEPIGEAWLLSDRDEYPSRIADGPLAGSTIADLIRDSPQQLLGAAAAHLRRFPLLLKLLDVCDRISVQVHPTDDQTALLPQGESGKTEAWQDRSLGRAAQRCCRPDLCRPESAQHGSQNLLIPATPGRRLLDDQELPGFGAVDSSGTRGALASAISVVAAAAGTSAPRDFPQSCLNLSRNRFQPVSTNSFDMVVSERRSSRRDVVEAGVQRWAFLFRLHDDERTRATRRYGSEHSPCYATEPAPLPHHTVSPRRGPRLR